MCSQIVCLDYTKKKDLTDLFFICVTLDTVLYNSMLNPFTHTIKRLVDLRLRSKRLMNTLRQKEKLIILSNFTFYHTIFNSF